MDKTIPPITSGSDAVSLSLGVLIVLALATAGLWDIYIITRGNDDLTVSAVLRAWFAAFPPGAVALGILIGHLVWPGIRR